ncbi:hypothetical protein KKB55_03365 [Myxococcota bacterium]|nr:hypothetical protein [Myxococcota bacterium]MBU1896792.1 hypothetical protein [Myxococcota bacterium]
MRLTPLTTPKRRRAARPVFIATRRAAPLLIGLSLLLGCVDEGAIPMEREGEDAGDAQATDAGPRRLDLGPRLEVDLSLRAPRCAAECCRLVHLGPPEITTCLDPDEDEVFRWAIQNLGWETGLYPSCCALFVSGPYRPIDGEGLCAYLIEGRICD